MISRIIRACLVVLLLPILGCMTLNKEIKLYQSISSNIKIGDSLDSFLVKYNEIYMNTNKSKLRSPETFKDGDNIYDIYYYRSAWYEDGLNTDDEFTPYVFMDKVLIAIGWTALGGERTVHSVHGNQNFLTRLGSALSGASAGMQANNSYYQRQQQMIYEQNQRVIEQEETRRMMREELRQAELMRQAQQGMLGN